MRTTIDKAGRVVIPKALRDQVGLRPGPVELTAEGAGLRIEPVAGDALEERGQAAAATLLDELHLAGIAGGAVYDALVGATAREHGLPLATRNGRALKTYRALDVRVELLR